MNYHVVANYWLIKYLLRSDTVEYHYRTRDKLHKPSQKMFGKNKQYKRDTHPLLKSQFKKNILLKSYWIDKNKYRLKLK